MTSSRYDIEGIIPRAEPSPEFEQQMSRLEERFMKAVNGTATCTPDEGNCWVHTSPETGELAEIAANLRLAGEEGTEADRNDLWDFHGIRRCLLAFHVAEAHPELLPEPAYVLRSILFEQHRPILEMAARRDPWKKMPEGGREALDAGLVAETDPAWMMSDDIRAANGFQLTEEGRSIMLERGHASGCAWCARMPHGPIVTVEEYCGNCRLSIGQYGLRETPEGTGCGYHAGQCGPEAG